MRYQQSQCQIGHMSSEANAEKCWISEETAVPESSLISSISTKSSNVLGIPPLISPSNNPKFSPSIADSIPSAVAKLLAAVAIDNVSNWLKLFFFSPSIVSLLNGSTCVSWDSILATALPASLFDRVLLFFPYTLALILSNEHR